MKTSTAALVAILILSGCTGEQAATNARSSSAASATASPAPKFVLLTDTGCASTPASLGEVAGGTNAWRLRNQSASLANFQLLRIEDGSFDELNAFFRGSPAPEASTPPTALPFVEEELQIVTVEPDGEGLLTAELRPGVHGIVCIVLDEEQHIDTVYLTGPFEMAGG